MLEIRKIHLIFKTHLDVGYTDFAHNVVANYFENYIPKAISLAEEFRREGATERFIWTTGSWLIYEYLEQVKGSKRDRLEQAILNGDIVWHGLPFTMYCEMMDASLFRFGLSLSQELDQRYGRKTSAAKMTDVPGHTRAIVPLMAEVGLQFLHIGVNAASTPPDVPPVFLWKDPGGAEMMVMIHKGSYGDLMIIPGMEEAIAFAHTNDNLGPQSPEELRKVYADMRERFPGAVVQASTMDAFAYQLARIKDRLPVITQEIGNSWIHGAASDPKKVAQFRELQRLRRLWLVSGKVSPKEKNIKNFSRFLLMVPEHTWGMDEKVHLDDYAAYSPEHLAEVSDQSHFQKFAASWDEQRQYLQDAVSAFQDSPLAEEAAHALLSIEPSMPILGGFQQISPEKIFQTPAFQIGFDPQSGAICHLAVRGTHHGLATYGNPLGLFRYQAFSQADYDRYYHQYVKNKREVKAWAIPDFTKPGIAAEGARSQEWLPRLKGLYHCYGEGVHRFIALLCMDEEAVRFGCPRQVTLQVATSDDDASLELRLQWFEKPASRLPEALWLSFCPNLNRPTNWTMDKLGEVISPLDVVRESNRHLHTVGTGVSCLPEIAITSLDAALVAPGDRSLLDFNNRQPVLQRGMHFLLYDNLWGTNHPMWYDEDALFRFMIRVP